MLRTFALMGGLLAGLATASAADLPVKAPRPSNPFINYVGSGLYWFGGGFGGATTVDVGVAGKLNASGAGVSAGGGYMWGHTTTWTAVDIRVNYATTGASGLCGIATACSFRQNTSVEARVKYGADSSKLANLIPSFGLSDLFNVLPPLRDGVVTPAHPYVFAYGEVGRNRADVAVVDDKKWRGELGAGVGIVHQVGSNRAIDTWAKCGIDPASKSAGVAGIKLGTSCRGGLDLIF